MNLWMSVFSIGMISTAAFASNGTISGGGGKLVKHSNNPWFLENTSSIGYCLHSSSDFGVAANRLDQLVQEVIEEWRLAFSNSQESYYNPGEVEPFGQINIATQQWKVDCQNPDVNFQFGELNSQQLEAFDKVTDYIGAAIRTEYDLKNLRSKGFVYVAPLSGNLKPDTKDIDLRAWTVADNLALKIVLRHELGHVFGISHSEDSGADLMYERLPEYLITTTGAASIEKDPNYWNRLTQPLSLFLPRTKTDLGGCGDDALHVWETHRDLLGIPIGATCVQLKFQAREVILLAGKDATSMNRVGSLNWSVGGAEESGPMIKVHISEEQQVFTKLPSEVPGFSWVPLYGEVYNKAEFYQGIFRVDGRADRLAMKIRITGGDKLHVSGVTADLKQIGNLIMN